jgi:hypothetical protein
MPSGLKPGVIDATRYPDLRKWVVSSLSNHKKPNDIIFQLCRRTDWDWNQAKRFVEQVVELDQKQVHQKRMPLLLGSGIFFVITGAFLFISAYNDVIAVLKTLEPPWDFQKFINAALNAEMIYYMVLKVLILMATVAGGSYGIVSALKAALIGEGEDVLIPPPPPLK